MRHRGQAGEQVADWGIGHYETTAERLFPAARAALSGLLAPYGFRVETAPHRLAYTGSSARDFLDTESRNHPLAVAGFGVLEPLGQAEALRARLLEILENGNEDRGGFRVTSRYVVATARRDG